jgi:hypothetical protein
MERLYSKDNYELVNAIGIMSGYWLTSSCKEELYKKLVKDKNWKKKAIDWIKEFNKAQEMINQIKEEVKTQYFEN